MTNKMARRQFSRRDFLGTATAVATFSIVPRHVLGGPRHVAPSDKLNVAGIGVGGQGGRDLNQAGDENVVALCDVDLNNISLMTRRFPNTKIYQDFRELLEKQKDLDAVIIGTPDHTHAIIAMAAMQAGKHVYCEKPLCHDVFETRALAKAARETKVVTQMGIQGHSTDAARSVVEWITDGAIGEVREVDAWCSLSYYPWGHAYWSSKLSERPKETPPVPDKLNWDLWLGPAPMRPYHPTYHPGSWRAWWDFGNGMMGDRGAHTLDPVVWALKLGMPTSVEATSCGLTKEVHPLSAIVTFQFPARGNLPPVKLTWYEGTRPPCPEELADGKQFGFPEGGALLKGSKGKLVCGVYGDSPRLLPDSLTQAYKRPEKTIPRIKGHVQNWVRACKGIEPVSAPFEYSAPLTEICLLGNIAKRMDTRIEWDAPNMKVTNVPEANKYIRADYRQGWSLGV
ncbi:MAG: Gfo/Idh/MocA family oxidoreductase [Kiritimatiellaeota bacterium]|nr:Gfo/Idh/MocA family oxidoreductase [Kiritimatiellota bacterium]